MIESLLATHGTPVLSAALHRRGMVFRPVFSAQDQEWKVVLDSVTPVRVTGALSHRTQRKNGGWEYRPEEIRGGKARFQESFPITLEIQIDR